MNMEGNWNGALGQNKYQYNGKEWNDDFGLGFNDYGFRIYDPSVGRWWIIDALTEKHIFVSGYTYVLNNPVMYQDWLELDTLQEVTISADRPKTSESWRNYIGSWSYQDFESFRKGDATDIMRV